MQLIKRRLMKVLCPYYEVYFAYSDIFLFFSGFPTKWLKFLNDRSYYSSYFYSKLYDVKYLVLFDFYKSSEELKVYLCDIIVLIFPDIYLYFSLISDRFAMLEVQK